MLKPIRQISREQRDERAPDRLSGLEQAGIVGPVERGRAGLRVARGRGVGYGLVGHAWHTGSHQCLVRCSLPIQISCTAVIDRARIGALFLALSCSWGPLKVSAITSGWTLFPAYAYNLILITLLSIIKL